MLADKLSIIAFLITALSILVLPLIQTFSPAITIPSGDMFI
ncbi:hypothetical protein FM106_13210 [Brachybacterium faecium]|nr:hypothetical protein FM106_13210 [Brachybacterium faecium]